MQTTKEHIIVAISGASGATYAIRMLKLLKASHLFETHLVISDAGKQTIALETELDAKEVSQLADHTYDVHDMMAPIASGSFKACGMIVAPCSMRSLASIAHSFCDNLLTRAADVTLKERRKLVLLTRETPLTLAHLRNMQAVTEMGGIIFPPVPAFYCKPSTLDDIVNQTACRVLDLFGVPLPQAYRWNQ